MYCNKCGAQLDDDSLFCFSCGAKVEAEKLISEKVIPAPIAQKMPDENKCPFCSAELEEDCDFCTECGKPLNKEVKRNEVSIVHREIPLDIVDNWNKQIIKFFKNYIKNPYKTNQETNDVNILITVFALVAYLITATFVSHKVANAFWYDGDLRILLHVFGFVYGLFALLLPFLISMISAKVNKISFDVKETLFSIIQRTLFLTAGNLICILLGCFSYTAWEIGLLFCLSVYIALMCSVISGTVRKEEDIFRFINIFGAAFIWIFVMLGIIVIEIFVIYYNVGYNDYLKFLSFLA